MLQHVRFVTTSDRGGRILNQFNKRLERIERARTAAELEVARMITAAIEREDA